MSKIQLTVDTGYCESWGAWEGVRELVSNAKDAEDMDPRNAMEIKHSKEKSQLVIRTRDAIVDPAALLVLGRSSKRGRGVRGLHGEGFAVGCLALTRAGHPVSFRNADTSWRCTFERVEDGPLAGQELLTFFSRAINRTSDFVVTIDNITKEVWDAMRPLFLFLAPPPAEETVAVDQGTLILSEDRRGMVYVRGVFVRRFETLECAYDLRDIQLDRDRQMINEWTLGTALSDLWVSVLSGRKDVRHAQDALARRAYDLAKGGSDESRHFRWHTDNRLVAHMKAQFEAEHGEGAVPVSTMAEAQEITDLGARPAVVNATLRELLSKTGLSVEAARASLEGQVQARLLPSQLTDDERKAARTVEALARDYVVVEFRGQPACKMIDEGGLLAVDRRVLAQPTAEILRKVAGALSKARGTDATSVLATAMAALVDRDAAEADAPEECDECGATIPDSADGMINAHHAESCSLYPHADAPKAEAEQGA
jgi:hypothetical protein